MYTIFSNNSFCQFRVLVFTEEKSKFMLQDYARRHIPDHQMCSDVVKYSTRHVTTHMNASRPMHMGGNWTALQRGNSHMLVMMLMVVVVLMMMLMTTTGIVVVLLWWSSAPWWSWSWWWRWCFFSEFCLYVDTLESFISLRFKYNPFLKKWFY